VTAEGAEARADLGRAPTTMGRRRRTRRSRRRLGGPVAGALAGDAVSTVENLQAYRDGRISGLRALGNTAVDAATGALPFGVSTLARLGAKKLGL
jgi:hypothetical protein